MTDAPNGDILAMTTEIVSSHVSNNALAVSAIPELIHTVHDTLTNIASNAPEALAEPVEPAVPVKKSVTADYLICLEDGKKLKLLKRHLRTKYNLTPQEYRQRWGLPSDYPMVAPNYAQARSSLAKKIGLGNKQAA